MYKYVIIFHYHCINEIYPYISLEKKENAFIRTDVGRRSNLTSRLSSLSLSLFSLYRYTFETALHRQQYYLRKP